MTGDAADSESMTKSRQRVADHGEVFTPPLLVESMINLVDVEASRIDSRVLEPACGSGNFLVAVLNRKLETVASRYGGNEFERRHQSLLALMSIYGIELLADNVAECRLNLVAPFASSLQLSESDAWYQAAMAVLDINVVHGDALTMKLPEPDGRAITFAEWSYLGKGRYQRRDFRFDTLTQMAAFGETDTLFEDLGSHEIFTPVRDYGSMSVTEIAGGLR